MRDRETQKMSQVMVEGKLTFAEFLGVLMTGPQWHRVGLELSNKLSRIMADAWEVSLQYHDQAAVPEGLRLEYGSKFDGLMKEMEARIEPAKLAINESLRGNRGAAMAAVLQIPTH